MKVFILCQQWSDPNFVFLKVQIMTEVFANKAANIRLTNGAEQNCSIWVEQVIK